MFMLYTICFSISVALTVYHGVKEVFGVHNRYMSEYIVISTWLLLSILYQMHWCQMHWVRVPA